MKGIIQLVVVLTVLTIALFPSNVLAKDNYEPNNSFAAAYQILSGSIGSSVSSYISTPTDVDYFKFAGTDIAHILVASPDGETYDAYLYDKNYNLLGSTCSPNYLDFFQYETIAGETYYVKVVSRDGCYDVRNAYTLYVTLPPL